MPYVKIRPVKLKQPQRVERVIVEPCFVRELILAQPRHQPPVGIQPFFHKAFKLFRLGKISFVSEYPCRARERHQHKTVPRRQHLVVHGQLHSPLAEDAELLAKLVVALRQKAPAVVQQEVRDVVAVEVALGRNVIALAEVLSLRADDFFHLVLGEEIVRALAPAGVGVLRRGKAAALKLQLAQAVVERRLRHIPPEREMPVLPRLSIAQRKHCVIVQRLFKMRRKPLPVGRVPAEAAADMVVDPAAVHLLQGVFNHCAKALIPGG